MTTVARHAHVGKTVTFTDGQTRGGRVSMRSAGDGGVTLYFTDGHYVKCSAMTPVVVL